MATVNKAEISRIVAEKSGLQIKQATAAVDAMLDEILNRVENGDTVRFNGFGTFSQKVLRARSCRNPATGEQMEIGERRKLNFKNAKPSA